MLGPLRTERWRASGTTLATSEPVTKDFVPAPCVSDEQRWAVSRAWSVLLQVGFGVPDGTPDHPMSPSTSTPASAKAFPSSLSGPACSAVAIA